MRKIQFYVCAASFLVLLLPSIIFAQFEEPLDKNSILSLPYCSMKVPPNLFNIGDSIGEGVSAHDDIGAIHHETVWSTGFDRYDQVYTLNERFEDIDSTLYYENNAARDAIFNHAIEGDEMEDFRSQAISVITAASKTPSGKVSMVTVFLGSNEFVLYENKIYSSFKMFGHPYVIFPITMSVSFFLYIFQF